MGREQTDGGPVSHMLISSGAKNSLWKSQEERDEGEYQYPFSFHLCHSLQCCELN